MNPNSSKTAICLAASSKVPGPSRIELIFNPTFSFSTQEVQRNSQNPSTSSTSLNHSSRNASNNSTDAEELNSMLKSSENGKVILGFYSKNKRLTEAFRNKLVDVVVSYELQKASSNNYKVSADRWAMHSKSVSTLFPSERPSVYYIPAKSEGNNKPDARGKFINKYNNERTALRSVGLIPPVKRRIEAPANEAIDSAANCHEDIKWIIKNPDAPWHQLVQKWTATRERRAAILKSCPTVQAYFETFSVLKAPHQGHLLVLEDFNSMFEKEKDNFFFLWNDIAEKILKLVLDKVAADPKYSKHLSQNGIDINDIKDAEARQVVALKLLPILLPAPSIVNKSATEKWKPSRVEAIESLFLTVESFDDLQVALQRRKDKLMNVGIKPQPICTVCRNDGTASYYVNIERLAFQFDSAIEAFDFCFKAFYVFNFEFPPESRSTFFFLSQYVYKMPGSRTKSLPTIESLASDLEL